MSSLTIRPVQLPQDGPALDALDGTMTTDLIYEVVRKGWQMTLVPTKVPQLVRTFQVDDWRDPDRMWDRGWVAEANGTLAGFAATRYELWNRRLSIWHLYVARAHRRQGIARALLGEATRLGRSLGAATVWLETQNINVPAIRAYERLGFSWVGCDLTLYQGTPHRDEVAVFMAQSLSGDAPECRSGLP